MSIPKEPRQLMINIMYLVLTALLALNVSAEIFNAFEMVDGGLKSASASLDKSNAALPPAIIQGALKKKYLSTYVDRLDDVQNLSKEATSYIDSIVNVLIDESGTPDGVVDDLDYVFVGEENKKELKGKKNYDGTTRIMVDAGLGEELKTRMMEYKAKFALFADEVDLNPQSKEFNKPVNDRAELLSKIPINIDEKAWKLSPNKKINWSDFTFGHMPLGATMPIFSKFKNDIKSAESSVLNYLASQVGTTTDVVLDKFTVVSAPKKSYIIKGEKFDTDIFLSASAGKQSETGIAISVNGQSLRADDDGVAKFSQNATAVGIKKYSASITVSNPSTGEKNTYKKEFEYEVGERSVAISASKMNVFYIGVDNPVEVSAAGVASSQVKVSMTGGGGAISRNSDGTYTVNVKTPTKKGADAKINVSAPGMNASKDFRVKRIPDPVPVVGAKSGGVISSGELKSAPGVLPILKGFDFDAKCKINGFRMVRVAPRADAEIVTNQGGRFTSDAKANTAKARPGDRFFFENIKCTCPGDKGPRDIGTMSFLVR
ncbi:MAG: gliding motility-associated protein GldM [Saprospiraceae bacterium]|jgi:gliding motility-associated protein GldM